MLDEEITQIFHWNTTDVPATSRFDQYIEMLRGNLIGVTTVCDDRLRFRADMQIARIGRLQIAKISGSAKRSSRTKRDISASGARAFHLVLGSTAWKFQYMERRLDLNSGDLVLIDTRHEYSSSLPDDFRNFTVSIPDDLVQTWLPNPTNLIGRRFPGNSGWGQVLSNYVTQLACASSSPLPFQATVFEDQLGALLALASPDGKTRDAMLEEKSSHLYDKIIDSIRQRCTDLCVTASDVAADVKISLRTLHRILAISGEKFGSLLIRARCEVAYRMLSSPQFDGLTIAEIGRRAGFVDTSHFSRTCRLRYGSPPARLRSKRQDI